MRLLKESMSVVAAASRAFMSADVRTGLGLLNAVTDICSADSQLLK